MSRSTVQTAAGEVDAGVVPSTWVRRPGGGRKRNIDKDPDLESIRRWWHRMGRPRYPNATRLLITADAGGSNGYWARAWKTELAKLAAETGLEITVCHYRPARRVQPHHRTDNLH